jgi:hypothetical protein
VGSFTVEVPRAWSVLEEERDSIFLGADDESAMVAIVVEDSEGMSPRQLALELSEELDGTRPVGDEDDVYHFNMYEDDIEYVVFVGDAGDDRYFMVIIGGDADNPGVGQILDSIDEQ